MNLQNVATVYLLNGDKILLKNCIGLRAFETVACGISGYFQSNEFNDPTLCALRELCRETGTTWGELSGMKLKYITTRLNDYEIRQQFIFFAELSGTPDELPQDERQLFWAYQRDIFNYKMPFINEQVLRHYYGTGRKDDCIYAGCVGVEKEKPFINWTKLNNFKADY